MGAAAVMGAVVLRIGVERINLGANRPSQSRPKAFRCRLVLRTFPHPYRTFFLLLSDHLFHGGDGDDIFLRILSDGVDDVSFLTAVDHLPDHHLYLHNLLRCLPSPPLRSSPTLRLRPPAPSRR